MEPTNRKEREYLVRRNEILGAAEKLFAERGFHKTTMSDLANLSEFSIGTIYNFFKSKDEVFFTLILEELDHLQEGLNSEINRHPPGLPQIQAAIEATLKFFQENLSFLRIFMEEKSTLELSIGAVEEEKLRKKFLSLIDCFRKLMALAIEKGDIQEIHPLELSYALIGIMTSLSHHWILYTQQTDLVLKTNLIYDLFLNGAIKRRGE